MAAALAVGLESCPIIEDKHPHLHVECEAAQTIEPLNFYVSASSGGLGGRDVTVPLTGVTGFNDIGAIAAGHRVKLAGVHAAINAMSSSSGILTLE